MATVTLGNIKFNWKGAWNSGTAYVIDDVVSLSGSSYVSIQAGTNQNPASASAYWQQMSSAGTNGTDLTTTLTTQGDILYRDGSGLQRLGAGTSGYFLKTQGTGANPVWSESSGGVIQTKYFIRDSSFTQSTSSFTDLGDFSLSITPTSTSNKIKLSVFFGAIDSAGNTSAFVYTRNGSQVGIGNAEGNRARASFTIQGTSYTASNHAEGTSHTFIDDPQTTSAITYKIQSATESGSLLYVNRPRDDGNVSDIYYSRTTSTFIAQEIVA